MGRRESIPTWVKEAKYEFCAVCGSTENLQYHHWRPYNGHNTVPENIIVLCGKHHDELHEIKKSGEIRHNYLVKQGIAKAQERGIHVGRNPTDYEKTMRLIAENSTQFNKESLTTEKEIMEMADVKPVCYAKCKRMLLSAMQEEVWPYDWKKPVQVRNRPEYEHKLKRIRGDAV